MDDHVGTEFLFVDGHGILLELLGRVVPSPQA